MLPEVSLLHPPTRMMYSQVSNALGFKWQPLVEIKHELITLYVTLYHQPTPATTTTTTAATTLSSQQTTRCHITISLVPPPPQASQTPNHMVHYVTFREQTLAYTIDARSRDDAFHVSERRDVEMTRLKDRMLKQFLMSFERQADPLPTPVLALSHKDRLAFVDALWTVPKKSTLDARDRMGFEIQLVDDASTQLSTSPSSSSSQGMMLMGTSSTSAYTYVKDSWVQCDSCEKWRRLPDHVNVSALESTWFCSMNHWDSLRNNCHVDEAAHEEESDTGGVPPLNASPSPSSASSEVTHGVALRLKRQRAKRLASVFKRSEKAYDEMRHTHVSLMHDGASVETKRRLVRCVGCFKTRALVHGLALTKIPSPFYCWMNKWDEAHASCAYPQEPFYDKKYAMNSKSAHVSCFEPPVSGRHGVTTTSRGTPVKKQPRAKKEKKRKKGPVYGSHKGGGSEESETTFD